MPNQLAHLKRDLVLGHHILDYVGQALDVAGQVTARLAGAETFWANRFGLGFDEAALDELNELRFDLSVASGNGEINQALDLHAAVYRARPDVNAVVHTHAKNSMALSSIGAPLAMVDQQASIFFEDIVFFNEHHGVFQEGKGETAQIAKALGQSRAAILKNHGIVVVGTNAREAVIAAQILEDAAEVQLKALAAGALDPMGAAASRQSKRFLAAPDLIDRKFEYYARRVLAARPDLGVDLR